MKVLQRVKDESHYLGDLTYVDAWHELKNENRYYQIPPITEIGKSWSSGF